MKQLYHDAECGPSVHELVFQHEMIEIKYPTMMGWIINAKDNLLRVSDWLLLDIMYYSIFQVRRISIEGYFGEGKLPVVELTIRAEGEKEIRGDLCCGVTLKGVKLSPITIERMYEQLPSSQPTKQSPPPSQPTKQPPPPSRPTKQLPPPSRPTEQPPPPSRPTKQSPPPSLSIVSGKLFLILHGTCIVNTNFNILYFQSKNLIQR